MFKLKNIKHELNSLIFKIESAGKLLEKPESLNNNEIQIISKIITSNAKILHLFIECIFILETKKTEKLPLLTQDIIKTINKDKELKLINQNNFALFLGKFETSSPIEDFFLDFLKNIYRDNINISSKEIKIKWKKT